MARAWLLCLLLCPAAAWSQQAPRRELIYGSQLMSPEEREQYRRDMRAADEPAAQAKVRAQNRERMRERARKRGVELRDPEGVVRR